MPVPCTVVAAMKGWTAPPPFQKEIAMYIAMNRFKVIKGAESAFEHVWLSRDTHLDRVPGFLESHLLRGPDRDDHVLYSSQRSGRAKQPLPRGRSPNIFEPPTVTPVSTSRSISAIRSSRASRQSRRSRIQTRGIRPPERRPVAFAIDALRYPTSHLPRGVVTSPTSNWSASPNDDEARPLSARPRKSI